MKQARPYRRKVLFRTPMEPQIRSLRVRWVWQGRPVREALPSRLGRRLPLSRCSTLKVWLRLGAVSRLPALMVRWFSLRLPWGVRSRVVVTPQGGPRVSKTGSAQRDLVMQVGVSFGALQQ